MVWPFGSSLHFGLIGLLGLAVSARRRGLRHLSLRKVASLGVAGMCLFALPPAALEIAAGKVPEYTSVAMFCAVPLMTMLASSALGDGGASRLHGLTMPSMMGLAGALLLFPVESMGSLRRWLFLALVLGCCVVVAVVSVWMHQLMQHIGVAAGAAVIGIGSAAALGAYGASVGWPRLDWNMIAGELLRCAVFDLPVICLIVWLAREIAPARLSARFLLVPLVTVVEGYALERGPVTARALVAVALLCAGGAMLLLKDEPEELQGLRLR
jgi:drug/metabolite transporter (DMT)-like permease